MIKKNNIIIVGGSSGIGLALAQKLSDRNTTVISKSACPVSDVCGIVADVRDPVQMRAAFSSINRADALVYCAGISLAAPVECVLTQDYRDLIEVNLSGAIEATKLAMPLLRKCARSSIIYVSSSGAVAPIAYDSFYSASKAALAMFARAVNLETDNVKACAVLVPGTQTRFSFKRKIYDESVADDKFKKAADSLIKIEQTGLTAEKVASKILGLIDSKTPPPVCSIGAKNKLALGFYRVMPQRIKHAIDKKIYGI